MEDTLYWLWLQSALGYSAVIDELIRWFKNAENVYKAGEDGWRSSGLFGNDRLEIAPGKIEALKQTPLSFGERIIEDCRRNDIKIITYADERYPEPLRLTKDFPAVLFVKGDPSVLNHRLPIAVVGTRKPSVYGISAAEKISEGLAVNGAMIVSGGALGIDSIAHHSMLKHGGKTVLVMGCGHGAAYLMENEPLRRSIEENGAVISEYPPFTKSAPYLFPKRNRIISGMSKGVVVIEAGEKSGTLNTAGHAFRQGRDVFAVPGDIASVAYSGSNKLIRSGAHAVFSADDIISFYSYFFKAKDEIASREPHTPFDGIDEFPYGKKETPVTEKSKQSVKITAKEEKNAKETLKKEKIDPESVSKNAFIVYNLMSGEKITLDDLKRKSSLPVNKVLSALTELEMLGLISSCEGNSYVLS